MLLSLALGGVAVSELGEAGDSPLGLLLGLAEDAVGEPAEEDVGGGVFDDWGGGAAEPDFPGGAAP